MEACLIGRARVIEQVRTTHDSRFTHERARRVW